jgi:hypothetical protein
VLNMPHTSLVPSDAVVRPSASGPHAFRHSPDHVRLERASQARHSELSAERRWRRPACDEFKVNHRCRRVHGGAVADRLHHAADINDQSGRVAENEGAPWVLGVDLQLEHQPSFHGIVLIERSGERSTLSRPTLAGTPGMVTVSSALPRSPDWSPVDGPCI